LLYVFCDKIYTTVQSVRLFFLSKIQRKQRYCEILLQYFYLDKAEFSASLLQSAVSHDSSEIIVWWFGAQENFLLLSMLKTDGLLHIFVETHE